MTAPNREQHKNDASTSLNGAINNSVTSITVTSGSVFPSTGNFRVMCGSEIMVCTDRSSNTLTVVRGQDGTSAASHADTSTISMVYSTEGLTRMFQDNDPLFGYSSRKPVKGLYADDGTTILTASDFTWQNQGGATVTDDNGTLVLNCPTDSSRNLRCLERSAPSTPYTYIAAFEAICPGLDSDAKPAFGMFFRESSSSKLMVIGFINESFFGTTNGIHISRYSDTSTLFTTNRGPQNIILLGKPVWLKIENDGTNTNFYLSADGISWILYLSESKTSYFSGNPDKVGWWGGNLLNSGSGALDLSVRLHHWSKGE